MVKRFRKPDTVEAYNYNDSTTWTYVKSVFNSYEDDLYKPLDISYIQKLVSEYYKI